MNQYHISNTSWTTVNVSAAYGHEMNVKQGTPLSVVARSIEDVSGDDWVSTLYYLNSTSHLQELVTQDQNMLSWGLGALGSYTLLAANNSKIAAVASNCPSGCKGGACITYQDTALDVQFTCYNNWAGITGLKQGYSGAGLAAVPFASSSGTNLTDVSEMRLFYYTNTVVDLTYYNIDGLIAGKSTSNPPHLHVLLAHLGEFPLRGNDAN
jgi:hypothetical protein